MKGKPFFGKKIECGEEIKLKDKDKG